HVDRGRQVPDDRESPRGTFSPAELAGDVPLTNVSPAPNETAGRRCRSVLGVGEGQAGVAGLTRDLAGPKGGLLPAGHGPSGAPRAIAPVVCGDLKAGAVASG